VTDEVLVTSDYNTIATPLTLTSLSPAEAVAGSPGFTLTLNGTGFTPSSPVSVNGAFLTVTFISSTQLSVPVTATQIATPGAFQVWVDSFPSGAVCAAFAALPFTVDNSLTPTPTPTPTATSDVYSYANTNSDRDSDTYSYTNTDSDSNTYPYADTGRDSNSHPWSATRCAIKPCRNCHLIEPDGSLVD
jgi:hypothetical protein